MPYNFDANYYKKKFDTMFGAGQYDAGMARARQIGQSNAQVGLAKQLYNQRHTSSGAVKKSYQDAVEYISNNKDQFLNPDLNGGKSGAYQIANEIRNDPAKQAEIKAQGYNVSDYINALYAGLSDGNFRSEREYNQHTSQMKKDIVARDKAYKDKHGMTQWQAYDLQKSQQKQPKKSSSHNIFGDLLNRVERNTANVINSAGLGIPNWLAEHAPKALQNVGLPIAPGINVSPKTMINAQKPSTTTSGKVMDTLSNLAGYAVPGELAVKGAKLLKVGKGAEKGLQALGAGSKLAKLGGLSAEGAVSGGLFGVGQQGVDAMLHPNSQTLKQRMANVGFDIGLGLVGDPLLHGVGKGLGKLLKRDTSQVLPKQEPLALPPGKVAGYLPEGQKQLPPPMRLNEPITIDQPSGPAFIDGARREKNPYTVKFEKLVSDFNQLQSQGLIPPGREEEVAREMWTHLAGPHDPSFDEMLHLANDRPMPTPQQKLDLIKQARKNAKAPVYGIDNIYGKLKLKQPMERQPLQYVGQGSMPDLKVQQVPKDIPPLNFSKKIAVDKNQLQLNHNVIPKKEPKALNISPQGNKLVKADSGSTVDPKVIQQIKDIKPLQVGTLDIYRLANKLPKAMRDRVVKALDRAKQNHVNMQEQLTNDFYNKIVKGLGINKDTKLSALVQDFGEKTLAKKFLKQKGVDYTKLSPSEIDKINLAQLKKISPNKWQDIVKADEYIHNLYDNLINEVNKVRAEIYPGQADKIVPKRDNYYHHFQKLDGFSGLKNLFSNPANIDPHLEGISPFTKPKAKFQGFMQKRGNGEYHSDAIGGVLKYLQAASHSINIDPVIPVLRKTADELANATESTKNANKIIEALQGHANDLAGKTNPYLDPTIQKVIGRKGFAIVNWLNSRVKKNMILGNLSSAIGQIGNIPLGIAKAKGSSVKGLASTVFQMSKELLDLLPNTNVVKNDPIYQSHFLKERFSNQLYTRFDKKLTKQPEKMAGWILETVDKSASRFIWNSMYQQALKKGISNPIKYADTETRNVVAGRGIGEVPLMQKSKSMQILAPFTLEVGNQWRVLSKMVGEKDAAGIITFLIASYGLNKAVEAIRGSGVSFDPIGAIQEGYNSHPENSTEQRALNAGASLFGEIVGNIPGGNLLTNLVNTKQKVPGTNVTFTQLFGDRNPNRFGTGLTIGKAVTNPEYLVMPFGANQLRKTLDGAQAIQRKGIYQDKPYLPLTGNTNELKFPINTSNPLKDLKMLALGPNSTSEAQNFYNLKHRKLSVQQTAQYKQAESAGQGKQFYDNLMRNRNISNIERKIKKLSKDNTLSNQEKQDKLMRLINLLQKSK